MVQNRPANGVHEPVLLSETLRILKPGPGDSYLDLTAGYGGHAAAILEQTGNYSDSLLVDRDSSAIQYLEEKFKENPVPIMHSDFMAASQNLLDTGREFDIILADLGVSSLHLDKPDRGFAISLLGPLDMRMDQRQATSAETIVNQASEEELIDMLRKFGEEPKAKQIARALIANRPIKTTQQLAEIVAKQWPGRSKRHPATRTFQALRIAVNDELGQLQESLDLWLKLLKPGGRLGVITFHSLEDRIVKEFFRETAGDRYDSDFRLLTKHPESAAENEIVFNPRSRSAKLRAVVKINTKGRVGQNADTGKINLPNVQG